MEINKDRSEITIRRAEPRDYEAVTRIFEGPRVIWGTLQLPFPSAESWRQRLEEPLDGYFGLLACWADEVVGELGLLTFPRSPRRRHAGKVFMAVQDDWQGRGVGSALMQAAIGLADNWLNLSRLELEVFHDNEAAIHLYEKCGFTIEGTMARFAFRDGQYVDTHSMARVKQLVSMRGGTQSETRNGSSTHDPGAKDSFTVRRIEPSDYLAVHRIFSGPRAVWGTLQVPFPSADSWRKRLAESHEGTYHLGACVGNELVGQLGVDTFPRSPRRRHAAEMGMAVRDDWQGKGVGTALMQAAVDLVDRWLNVSRLELEVYTDNLPAIQLYQKFGFALEGTLAGFAFRDGGYVDAYRMARLRSDVSAL